MPQKPHLKNITDPWVEFETMVTRQLSMQVTLSFERHHAFMLDHGLGFCKTVADIGTGNANFLGKLAAKHPEMHFTGVDEEAVMIGEAGRQEIPNADFILADALDERVMRLLGRVDGIMMRYFVLHLRATRESLPHILSEVKPGTRLWIFDLDTDFTRCDPPDGSFALFQKLVNTFCARHAAEIRLSSMLPPILESAGFIVREVKAEPFNNREIDSSVMADFLYREAVLYHHFLYGNHESEMLRAIHDFLFERMAGNSHFVQYGMAMIAAEKK